MATRAEWSKTGLKLSLNVASLPAPRPRQVFTLPDLRDTGHPFLTLALLNDPDIGLRGIEVTVDDPLPETGGHWTLRWKAGTSEVGRQIVSAGAVYQLNTMLPLTTYIFHLEHLSGTGGRLTRYTDATITTPKNYRLPTLEEMDAALTPSVVADGTTAQFLVRSNVKRTNLIKRAKDYSHASWTKFANGAATVPVVTANAGLAMDGTMTADRITFNRGGATSNDICTVSQNVTGQTVGSPYTPWIELKSNTGVDQQVMIYWGGLATGKGGGTITNVVTVTPEWKRFYCADLAASSTITIQFGTRVIFGDQVLDILVGHSQVETGTEPTPAILTLDSAVSDYGLKAEDWRGTFALSPVPRENIVRYSQDFTQAVWIKRGACTVTGNNIQTPDGTMTGDTIAGLGAAGVNDLYQSCTGVTGSHYEPSFWIYKISTSGTLRLQNTQGGGGRWDINLALLPDGWSKMVSGHAAVTVVADFVCANSSIGPFFVSPSGTLSFGLWQFQMDPGLVATPEIPTTAVTVTVTDYTVSNSLATLSPVPVQGTILRGLSSNASAAALAAAQAAATAQTAANTANADLANIASDSLLTPDEKPRVIQDRDVIVAEQAGIDAQATAYAITTEKTAYDTAVNALTTYLATLTTPVLWSTLTGNTTIVGATFRTKFADVYTTRQVLLNKISAQAKALADAAQATANSASAIIANASLDTKITNLERPSLRNLRASLAASVTSAKAKAQAMVPSVPQTALDTAWSTFTTNVDPILAASVDSTIVKATFDGWWSAVYSAITDLQGTMAQQANNAAALAAPAIVTDHAAISLPSATYPAGRLVYQTGGTPAGTLWQVDAAGTGWQTPAPGVAISATYLAADLAITGVIRSPNYVAGSYGNAPQGFKLSGYAFTTTFKDGSTSTNCFQEIGGDANFGGYKVQTVADKVMTPVVVSASGSYVTYPANLEYMSGLGMYFTPKGTSALVIISGTVSTSTRTLPCNLYARYGTGTAPSQLAAATGSVAGNTSASGSGTNQALPFTIIGVITGLTPGTQYWADMGVAGTGQSYSVAVSNCVVMEL